MSIHPGVELGTYTEELRRVPVHLDHKPHLTFDLAKALGPQAVAEASEYSGETLIDRVRNLGMEDFANLTVDQLAKVRRASFIMMGSSVEDAFRNEPRLRIIQKIENSMWRWGVSRSGWNEVVDAYDGIRRFTFHPDFEVRLDHTTGHNERGHSQYSRTFLDGVFGFLIYYRGEHVMTLGFSVMSKRRLLIQQVQLKKRRGNRWLFKLSSNYVEFALSRFQESFPRHRLYLIDGEDNIRTSLNSYSSGLKDAESQLERATASLKKAAGQDRTYDLRSINRALDDKLFFKEKIEHVREQVGRVTAIYANTGRYTRGKTLVVNRLKHYALAA
jgi:hypothetical protein